MTDMYDAGSTKQAGFGSTARLLTWGGLLLLLVGSLLAYPYVHSRLATFSPAPTLTPSSRPSTAISTVTSAAPTASATAGATPISTPVPTSPHTAGATPTPALPTRIVIPAIGVDGPVVPVSWRTVEVDGQAQAMWDIPETYAVGWHETSAPLGAPGNTVLNGHNTTHGEIFRYLYTLEAGDGIIVYSDDVSHTYAVSETLILPEAGQPLEVRQENARYILPTGDERLTLVTCHPYGSLRDRLIVIAYPTTADGED